MFGQFKRVAIGALVLTFAITPGLVSACGGFFGPPNLSVDLNAFRVAFSVTSDHHITEIIGVNYTGNAADFSWIMPLPATPTVDVADQADLDKLQQSTDPTVTYPVNYCSRLNDTPLGRGGGGGGGGTLGTVGPYDYAIIKNSDPGQLVKWLRDNGYTIKTSDEPIINQYVKEGNTFVALRLKPGANVQDIQPVVFRYQSSKITIPVRLGAVASSANVPVQAWIFSDTQYAPTNYTRVDRPLLSAARAPNETLNMGGINASLGYVDPAAAYAQGVKAIQAKYQGHAFITEYAEKTSDLLNPALHPNVDPLKGATGPILQNMLTSFPYVTRLSAMLSPEQMTLDPLFAPISGAADVPAEVDLSKAVDPLTLYGCTTQAALDPRIVTEFVASHTTFADLRCDVGHPAAWVQSQFTTSLGDVAAAPQTIYAFAPVPVTAQMVDTFFKGGATPPMFIFTKLSYRDQNTFADALNQTTSYVRKGGNFAFLKGLMLYALGRQAGKDDIPSDGDIQPIQASFSPYRATEGDTLVLFSILASKSQWQANKALFSDMLAYGQAHQYFTDANIKDTLFLKVETLVGSRQDVYSLPIPNGWTAQFDSKSDIVIAPNGTADNGPAMRLTFVGGSQNPDLGYTYGSKVGAADDQVTGYKYPTETVQRLLSFYGLPGSPGDAAIKNVLTTCAVGGNNPATLKPVALHSGGRTGMAILTNEYVVGVYASDSDFSQYQAILQKMMDAYTAGYKCGAQPGPIAPPAGGTGVTCPKSPPSRLIVGGLGQVTPGAPDNMRSAPNTSATILAQLPPGAQFNVLKGPTCDPASGLAWWQVKYRNQTGWIAEGQGQDYYASPVFG
jgi:hypothetical protein